MGCFNVKGFYSHLPIRCGDKIGAIVCIKICTRDTESLAMNTFGAGYIPLCPPIYGEYDDYGGIEDMVETKALEIFEKKTGLDFHEFVNLNSRNSHVDYHTTNDQAEEYIEVLKKILPPDIQERFTITVIFERREILSRLQELGQDMMSCTNISGKFDSLIELAMLAGVSIFDPAEKALMKIVREHVGKEVGDCKNVIDEYEKLDKEVRPFYYQIFPDNIRYSPIFFYPFREVFDKKALEELKYDILGAMYLDRGLLMLGGLYCPSSYGYQEDFKNEHESLIKDMSKLVESLYD